MKNQEEAIEEIVTTIEIKIKKEIETLEEIIVIEIRKGETDSEVEEKEEIGKTEDKGEKEVVEVVLEEEIEVVLEEDIMATEIEMRDKKEIMETIETIEMIVMEELIETTTTIETLITTKISLIKNQLLKNKKYKVQTLVQPI